MKAYAALLQRERLLLTVAFALAALGLLAWQSMPRQEDPRLPELWAMALVDWPGADALALERLVVEPIEEALAEVAELRRSEVQVRAEVVSMELELHGHIRDTARAWDEVDKALARARRQFPEGVGAPLLDRDTQDVEAVLLAITGSDDRLRLKDAAERARKALLGLSTVKRVVLTGDPGEQVTVAVDDSVARRLGLTPQELAAQLLGKNRALPGGSLALGERHISLRPANQFDDLAALAQTPIRLPSGVTLPLAQFARVARTPAEPAAERMALDGRPAVALGVVPRAGINSAVFGRQVAARLEELAAALQPLSLQVLTFQPDQVQARMAGLERALLLATLVVGAVLLVAMGPRLALLVAAGVPLVMLAAVLLYALGGGVLHQMSVAALVIALGILVDNGIVVAEGIQKRLDAGAEPAAAILDTLRELALPLASATGTTMAAFLPMLLSSGPTAAFTSAIPVVVITALALSYLHAVLVTPVLARHLLRPRHLGGAGRAEALGRALARFAVRRPGTVVGGAAGVLALSAVGFGAVPQQFFPASDRSELIIELKLPEGSHLSATERVGARLAAALAEHPEARRVATYAGRSVPHFYYNLPQVPHSPHAAHVVVETPGPAGLRRLEAWLRQHLPEQFAEAEAVVRRIEQGPPVKAPIEVRLHGDDRAALAQAADQVLGAVAASRGARDARHDLGVGVPTLWLEADDGNLARHGLARSDLAETLFGRSRGLGAGHYRGGDDPVPIRVRTVAGERMAAEDLHGLLLFNRTGAAVPLAQVARLEPRWQPAHLIRRDRQRMVTVSAQLADNTAYSQVLADLRPRLAALTLPAGVRLSFGGDAEGAGEANASLAGALPLGLLALVAILMAQFNSFRRVGLVLLTIPLAASGIVAGLLLGGQPFGFMSLLGVLALAGVVVNNAIVLLDRVERARADGATVAAALQTAVAERFRPILLTSVTTVAGLLPLALSDSPLWPPMAWAMISGLVASTALTLIVVPALYRLLFARAARNINEDSPWPSPSR